MTAVEYTWRDSELRSAPLRAFNAIGAGLSRLGLERPALTLRVRASRRGEGGRR